MSESPPGLSLLQTIENPAARFFRPRPVTLILTLLLILIRTWAVSSAEANAAVPEQLVVGHFSAAVPGEALPPDWHPLTFDKIPTHTRYRLVKDHNSVVVRAVSRAAASGLMRKIIIDPKRYPLISWRWKVTNVYRQGDATRKAGDDYPARIYVTFAYDPAKLGLLERTKYRAAKIIYGEYPPLGSVNYIWANKAPVGTLVPSPFSNRAFMIAVKSGRKGLNRWHTESHNIHADFIRAFGFEPPLISGVAIMTDTDNTGETATAFYGDIVFRAAPPTASPPDKGHRSSPTATIP